MHYFGPDPTFRPVWKPKALLEIRFPLPSLSCALSRQLCRPLTPFCVRPFNSALSRSAIPGHSCSQFAADP